MGLSLHCVYLSWAYRCTDNISLLGLSLGLFESPGPISILGLSLGLSVSPGPISILGLSLGLSVSPGPVWIPWAYLFSSWLESLGSICLSCSWESLLLNSSPGEGPWDSHSQPGTGGTWGRVLSHQTCSDRQLNGTYFTAPPTGKPQTHLWPLQSLSRVGLWTPAPYEIKCKKNCIHLLLAMFLLFYNNYLSFFLTEYTLIILFRILVRIMMEVDDEGLWLLSKGQSGKILS